jgi:hypothetical protein
MLERHRALGLCNRLLQSCWHAEDTHRPELRSHPHVVPASAPRIDPRLLAALTRLDDGSRPVADLHRHLGEVADWLEVPRPSYEQCASSPRRIGTRRCTQASAKYSWTSPFELARRGSARRAERKRGAAGKQVTVCCKVSVGSALSADASRGVRLRRRWPCRSRRTSSRSHSAHCGARARSGASRSSARRWRRAGGRARSRRRSG